MCIIVGLGARQASRSMRALFQVTVSKSAIDRWVYEVGDSLPSEEEMIKLLHKEKPITQGHFDELFLLGTDKCLVALKDEHGRIVAAQEVENVAKNTSSPFWSG